MEADNNDLSSLLKVLHNHWNHLDHEFKRLAENISNLNLQDWLNFVVCKRKLFIMVQNQWFITES